MSDSDPSTACEMLGRAAAKCDVDAAHSPAGSWERLSLERQARQYREAQLSALQNAAREERRSFDAVIALIYAANALANYCLCSDGALLHCVCGSSSATPSDPANHKPHCLVARYYTAVAAVRKAAM